MTKYNLFKALLLVSIILISGREMYAGDFELIMTASEIERSKDSHTTEYAVVIKDNDFFYTKESSGHGSQDPVEIRCSITDIDINSIHDLASELELLKSETIENDKNVVGLYFTCKLIMVDANGRYEIIINGAENHFEDEQLVKNVKLLLADLQIRATKC